MKSERLVILVTPEEKTRLQKMARRAKISVAELVRAELPLSRRGKSPSDRGAGGPGPGRADGAEALTEGEMAALDRAAETLIERTRRANEALDRALGEIEATRAHFAKQHHEDVTEEALRAFGEDKAAFKAEESETGLSGEAGTSAEVDG